MRIGAGLMAVTPTSVPLIDHSSAAVKTLAYDINYTLSAGNLLKYTHFFLCAKELPSVQSRFHFIVYIWWLHV